MTGRRRGAVVAALLCAGLGAVAVCAAGEGAQNGGEPQGVYSLLAPEAGYINPKHQTALRFGDRSHWLQPWRAYQDTPPAARLRDAVGINLNLGDADQADAVCRHLARNGFRKVRIEFGWGSVSWDDPAHLTNQDAFDKIIGACKKWRLRPLFLLNGHHGVPCPVRFFSVRLLAPARKGDQVVHLDPARVRLGDLVPGHSGLSDLTDYWAAEVLFTRIAPDGTAALSKPLPKDLPGGADLKAATLKYRPFYTLEQTSSGKAAPVPEFEETLAGWLTYARTVAARAKRVLGTENKPDAGFDLEVWNELTFGSNFLSVNNYYAKTSDNKPFAPGDPAYAEILRRTVAFVTDPASNLPGVGVCDGFNNQWPWGAGSTAPPGLAALGKHPYVGAVRFPTAERFSPDIRPLDAFGLVAGAQDKTDGGWRDTFVPRYVAFFPEFYLTGIKTENLVRDLSPITTDLFGTPHGRRTRAATASRAPELWITEVNMNPSGADPGDLATYARAAAAAAKKPGGLSRADADRLKAKAVLRYLVSFTNKGPVRFYFYAARDDNPLGLGLVSGAFFDALKANKNAYPENADALGSPTMRAVRRLVAALPAPDQDCKLTRPRALSLLAVRENHHHKQWDGDPVTAGDTINLRPPLYNRDVLAFFPFQTSNSRFVVPLYVMTRNLARVYNPAAARAAEPSRLDLPPERYELTLGGVANGKTARLVLLDPLNGATLAPVSARPGSAPGRLVVDLPLTDSPRLLVIDETAPPPMRARPR